MRKSRAYASICSGVMVEVNAVGIPKRDRILLLFAEVSGEKRVLRWPQWPRLSVLMSSILARADDGTSARSARGTMDSLLKGRFGSFVFAEFIWPRGPRGTLLVPVILCIVIAM